MRYRQSLPTRASHTDRASSINSLPREDAAAPLTLLVNWTEELRP
jgi:hypothetical protein